ncbi:MAG: DUF5686 family protein [Saprospiraceae bacterium]
MNIITKKFSVLFLFSLIAISSFGQKVTRIRGKVLDANSGEGLPFVDVGLKGTNIGVSTDLEGNYNIETRFASDTVFASFLGYVTQEFPITKYKTNKINFKLKDESLKLETVEIREKKSKYSKKNNPALNLAQLVLSNKYINSLKGKDYYSYDQQEKINIDLNNITEKFKETPFIRNFDFMWEYIDTSEINGKTYLPVFLRETLSTIYFKKKGNVLKEVRKAARFTDVEKSLDPETVNDALDALYQDIDIYEEKIDLLDQQFVSPLAKTGEDFYRYYIIDTTEVNGIEAINLAFIPAVKGNFGFTGNIYVSNDKKYTVLKVDMGIIEGINLNFVRDLRIVQEFEAYGDSYIKTKDELIIDYAVTQNSFGLYGSRTLYFSNYNFEKPEDESVFSSLEKIVYQKNANERSDDFWKSNRTIALEKNDEELYEMVTTLKNDKFYKRYVYLSKIVITGFAATGPVSFGPVATFVSFNKVEGLNLRFGAETNPDFSDKIKFQGYLARTKKTELWKYSAGVTYTFNKNYYENPRHYIRFTTEKESSFPGQELEFFSPANFFLSFQRGDATKMLLSKKYEFNYVHEMHGFSYHIDLRHKKRMPYGSLEFFSYDVDGSQKFLSEVTTSEISLGFRYAPNEQFLQGKNRRRQIFNQYPILTVNFTQGLKQLGGKYQFSKLNLNLFKQYEWLTMGSTNLIANVGKTWGSVPYVLQDIPRGNQTYAYELASYNMMNFLEFVSDQYVSFNAEHHFLGYFLNRVPLIKKLKLREVISFKAVYGSLSDDHNPNINPDLVQFPTDLDGNPSTFLFDDRPYMEIGLGFTNILKILRFDIVQRINYIDHPNIPVLFGRKGLGIRVRTHISF